MMYHPTLLIILDGFGHAPSAPFNAISSANTPHVTSWLGRYPHTNLLASGKAVGLPPGFMGNSEVGHEAIGAGRVAKQPLVIINEAIARHELDFNPQLIAAFKGLAESGAALHFLGLLSDAGAHSHIDHLLAYLRLAKKFGIKRSYIHAILDGRDTPPKSAETFLNQLEQVIKNENYGEIASLHGRWYAMDRDNNWDRTEQSFAVLVDSSYRSPYASWRDVLEHFYKQNSTDEFIVPIRLMADACIRAGDGVLSFNFRPDRMRQLTKCFVASEQIPVTLKSPKLSCFITPVSYADALATQILFSTVPVNNTLKEILVANHKKIFTIAESEKYAHVTYFFNGEKEEVLDGEHRMLVPSIKTKTYAEHPCMSASQITQAVVRALHEQRYDFFLINYANADMVGHSGNMQATVKAIECLDKQLGELYAVVIKQYGGVMYVTADHGNAELMWDSVTNQPCTAHTTNPVPFMVIDDRLSHEEQLPLKELSDIAPYILTRMGINPPQEMVRQVVHDQP